MPIDQSLPRVFGVAVAKNSTMFALLESPHGPQMRKARDHFNQCARDAAKLAGASCCFAWDGTMLETKTGNRSIFDDVDE
jgi:hypothetical protein